MEQIGANLMILTEDPAIADICRRYWQQASNGHFIIRPKQLAAELGISTTKLAHLISHNSTVRCAHGKCPVCGTFWYTSVHSHEGLQHSGWRKDLCDGCKQEAERAQQEQARIERIEKPFKMHEAFERGAWQALKPLELNLLIEIARSANLSDAFRKVGLSNSRGQTVFERLVKMDLIGLTEDQKYWLDEELRELLSNQPLKRQVKSIFGSPKALDAFRQLKRQHAFVFPEIPVCAFVQRSDVEHLFSEAWHGNYFLTCRVDFVICDADGKPTGAVEYQGSYHYNGGQRSKDYFKRRMLEAVGLSLYEISGEIDEPDEGDPEIAPDDYPADCN